MITKYGLELDRVYLQAKCYVISEIVGRAEVLGFVESLVGLGASKGVFASIFSFSQGANEFSSTSHSALPPEMEAGLPVFSSSTTSKFAATER